MTTILAHFGKIVPNKMVILKIIYILLPNYNSIIATWSNILEIS